MAGPSDHVSYTNVYLENAAHMRGVGYVEVQDINEHDEIYKKTLDAVVALFHTRRFITDETTIMKVVVEPGLPKNKETVAAANAIKKTLESCITAGQSKKRVLLLDTGEVVHDAIVRFMTFPIDYQGVLGKNVSNIYQNTCGTILFACGKMSDDSKKTATADNKSAAGSKSSVAARFFSFGGC